MNRAPQESSPNSARLIRSMHSINKPARISAQELHKYVLGLISVFGLITISYPISMYRVAQKEEFAQYNSYLKPLVVEHRLINRK